MLEKSFLCPSVVLREPSDLFLGKLVLSELLYILFNLIGD